MSDNRRGGDWKEWSQHVLLEIQRLNSNQEKMQETLTENTKQLEIHIEGVRLAREQNQLIKAQMEKRIEGIEEKSDSIEKRIKPLETQATQVSFLTKIVLSLVAAPAAIYYIVQLIRMLMGKI